jgi:hypothetical protein
MDNSERWQGLLIWLRDTKCNGVGAALAKRINKDSTYVNRLFYPSGKKGRKSVGLEIMNACSEAFELDAGFWSMSIEDLRSSEGASASLSQQSGDLAARRERRKPLELVEALRFIEGITRTLDSYDREAAMIAIRAMAERAFFCTE